MKSNIYEIHTSEINGAIDYLRAGDRVLLSGPVYTARDAAHKRMSDIILNGGELPFEIKNSVIYYAGPTPAPAGRPIGSCGPTTSGRMDSFTPTLLNAGLKGMIGKGNRSEAVRMAIIKSCGIYFCAIGGAGALAAQCIIGAREIAFPDLGCESIKLLEMKDFPLITGIDCTGDTVFEL